MIPVLTAADVRRQDADAASRGIPVERLMENAGWAVARAARAMLGGSYGKRVVVVCGKGNNGGDGLVAARVLHDAGAAVTVVRTHDADASNALVAAQLARFRGPVSHLDALDAELARADLAIDAIVGVGLTRPLDGAAADAVAMIGASGVRVLSVDVPSGIDSDTGAGAPAIEADLTVTFGGYKPGLLFEPGRSAAGVIEVADIGTRGSSAASAFEAGDVGSLWPVRAPGAHKRRAGTLLAVAGSVAMPGAAALVVGASVHAGSGLTVLCAPEDVCEVVVPRVPEITTIPTPESGEGTIDVKALELVAARFDELDAIVIGPGVSRHPAAAELVRALVAAAPCPVVLDADAITAFSDAPALLAGRAPRVTILTPHAGELSRLTGIAAGDLDGDRLAHAVRIAGELRCVLAFKGPGTVVSDGAATYVNVTGNSALAQGGTGDVLAGIIGSVVAQATARGARADIPALVAAAVWVHGRAGDRIAARAWPHPANASALIDEIGPTLHEVLA